VALRLLVLALALAACTSKPQPHAKRDAPIAADAALAAAAPIDAPFADPSWATRFDFDGDHVPDPIVSSFSGGAHCCYKLSVELSQTHRVVALPFELDGGYVRGLDLSQPDNFHVEVGPDGIAALRMHIANYAGRGDPLPLAWVRAYGIHSHWIRVSMRDGTAHVDNVMWSCTTALDHLSRLDLEAWDGLPPCTRLELADFLDRARFGLERALGTSQRMANTKHVVVGLDASHELALAFDSDLVRVDVDHATPSAPILEAFGPPDVRLPYTIWGTTHRTGQWVWPARGLVVYVDLTGTTVQHVGVFAPTDLVTYRRDLAWP